MNLVTLSLGPQFPHLENDDNNKTYILELELIPIKCLE